MKIKLFAILAIGALVITVATAIGVANIQTLDRTVFIRENVRNEAALIKQSASFLTESYAERLVQIVSEVELTAPFSESAIFSSSDYNMVSAMVPAKDAGWKIVWSQRRGKRNIGWPKSEEAEMVKALPLAAVNQQRSIWFRHLSDSGHALYVLLVSVQLPQSLKTSADPNAKQMIVAGVLSNQAFAGAIESFKGTDREAVILDDRGYALGYTRQQYVGAPLTNHAMVLKLVKERNQEDYGEFKNAQGRKIIGAYARLSRTNLYAMVTRPIEGLPSLVKITYTSLAAYGLGGLLVCMLFGLLLFRSQITSFEYLQDFTISLAQGLPIRAPESYANMPQVLRESILKIRDGEAPSIKIAVEPPEEDELVSEASSDEVTQPEAELPQPATGQELVAEPRAEIVEQKAKQEYEKAIRGLIHNFKNPLGAILGQAQLARSKKDGEEPKEHYAVIEREARRLREALNELQQTVEGSELMSSARRVNLTELLLGLLVEMRPQFEEWNIKLRKDLKPATEVTGDEIHLKAVFRELLKNAIDALKGAEARDLYVASIDMGAQIQIVIQDSGLGIPSSDLNRAFDPFFTRKDEAEHKGMGLSIAKSVIETHGGKVAIESGVNSGTRLLVTLPLRNASASSGDVADSKSQSWENLPEIKTEELLGQKPITGSDAEDLPAAPAQEEITWVGRDPDLELLASEDEGIGSDTQAFIDDVISDSQSLSKVAGAAQSHSSEDSEADDFEFDNEESKLISVVPMTEEEMQQDDSELGGFQVGAEIPDEELYPQTDEVTKTTEQEVNAADEIEQPSVQVVAAPDEKTDESTAQEMAAMGLEDEEDEEDDDDDLPMIAIRKPKVGHDS